jgi:TonB-linked SusC/RagA family outer membrane protein
MKKLIGLIACVMLLGLSSSFAQSHVVTGKVVDETGLGFPGVSVSILGTTEGVNTDIDGKWELTVSADDSIVVSFVGMKTQTIKIGDKTFFNIILKEDRVTIEEVIVVAYGTATKKSFTGSAVSISAEKIESKNVSEISKALSGEIAGVNVINSSGQPGEQATIRIRGFGSVNASAAPLYIVDGVAFDGDISSISPSDISSTTVLKDASATSIYGSRGANGVILITTKRGKSGKTKIEAEFKYGVNMKVLPQYNVMSNQEKYLETAWESIRNKKIIDGYNAAIETDDTIAFNTYWDTNKAAAGQYASTNIFNKNVGFDKGYNMWNAEGSTLIDPTTGKFGNTTRKYTPESWEDNTFNTGKRLEASVKMSGGTDKTSFFTSIGYLKDEGYYIGSDFQRLNTRLNLTHKVGEWLQTTTNISYSYMESNSPGQTSAMNNGFAFVNSMAPIYTVFFRDAQGKKIWNESQGRYEYDYALTDDADMKRVRRFASGINPAGSVVLDRRQTVSHNMSLNETVNVKINKDFSASSTFGAQIYIGNLSRLTNNFYGDAAGVGRIYKNNNNSISYTWNQLLKYKHSFGDHNIDAFIAHEVSAYENIGMYGSKNQIVRDDLMTWDNAIIMGYMGGSISDYSLESFFGQVKYDYDNKYFVHATVRNDGSSRFTKENRWGTFGSLGLAWMLSNEEFMADVTSVKDLKLKVSYGTLGNQSLLKNGYSNYYPSDDQFSLNNLDGKPSFVRDYKGNKDLTWEHSNSFNLGTSFQAFDRFEVELDYFRKNTTNLLFSRRVASSIGYRFIPVNDGELLNEGIEFNVLTHVVKGNDFYFDLAINGAHYKNEMLTMPLESNGEEKFLDKQGIFAYSKGHSLRDYYLREWTGVDSEDGRATWKSYTYTDDEGKTVYVKSMIAHLNGKYKNEKLTEGVTKVYTNAAADFVGKSAIPDVAGAVNFSLGYKGLSLSAQVLYSIGGYSYDSTYARLMDDDAVGSSNWHKDMVNRWQKPGDKASIPRLSNGSDKNAASASTRFLVKNDYFSLNNVKLAYALPTSLTKKLKLGNTSVYISGDNLWLSSARRGYTPNMSSTGQSDSNDYTPLTSITAGIKINF